MYSLNINENGYLLSVSTTQTSGILIDTLKELDLSGNRLMAYKWNGETLIFDENKFNELESATITEEDLLNAPTQLDIIEAQVTYTAMMTNTLLGG